MKKIPLTFCLTMEKVPQSVRKSILSSMAGYGVENIVLTAYDLVRIFEYPEYASQLLKEAEEVGLHFLDAHAPFQNIADLCYPGKFLNRAILMRQVTGLHIAADMGTKTITMHIGSDYRFYPEFSEQQIFEQLCRSLDVLVPEAENAGISIGLENIFSRNSSPEALLKIKECYPSPNLGFCYDAGHANIMENGKNHPECFVHAKYKGTDLQPAWSENILEKMLPHIVNCHLHDNDAVSDRHWLPGDGNINWKHVMDLLFKAPKLQVVQSEVNCFGHGIPLERLCRTFQNLMKCETDSL